MQLLTFNRDVRRAVGGVIAVALLVLLSIVIRIPEFNRVTGSQNLEAPYHVLLTIRALGESDSANHWFLPTVTLGAKEDKNIPWGATIPTKTGDYVYTSFTPPAFVVPFAIFRLLGVEPSTKTLAYFNAMLGGISVTLLFLLLLRVLRSTGIDGWSSIVGAVAASAIAIFSREALQTTGVAYWAHSLYQPIFILSILSFLSLYLDDKNQLRTSYVLIVLTFLGPLVEWTGYVFNVGLVLIALVTRIRGSRRFSLQVIAATMLACLLTLLHYSLAAGLYPSLRAFMGRFLARSSGAGDLVQLLQGYALSYGAFLVVIFALLVVLAIKPVVNQVSVRGGNSVLEFLSGTLIVALALSFGACIENLLMLQHATQFTFDRFKLTVPIALLVAFGYSRCNFRWRIILVIALVIASIHGVVSYKRDLKRYSSWASVNAENNEIAALIKKTHGGCSVLSTNINVRGYANLLFGHGIWEQKSLIDASYLMEKENSCQNILIEGENVYPDLPSYYRVTRVGRDGSVEVIWEKGK